MREVVCKQHLRAYAVESSQLDALELLVDQCEVTNRAHAVHDLHEASAQHVHRWHAPRDLAAVTRTVLQTTTTCHVFLELHQAGSMRQYPVVASNQHRSDWLRDTRPSSPDQLLQTAL